MEGNALLLPYALYVDEAGWEKELPREAEAALFFLIERENKRLLKKAWITTLVAKIYYSAWITPWKDGRGLLIDGLELYPKVVTYDAPPDCQTFIDEVNRSMSTDEYLNTLKRHSLTFLTFKYSTSFITTLLTHKGLISEIQSYIIHYREEAVTNALSLSPGVTWSDVSNFIGILKAAELDIEVLKTVKRVLADRTNQEVNRVKETIANIEKESLAQNGEEKARELIEGLKAEYQTKVNESKKKMDEEIKALIDEQHELQKEIEESKGERSSHHLRIKELERQSSSSSSTLNEIKRREGILAKELSDQTARLDALKAEQRRVEELIETRKGATTELNLLRENLLKIDMRITSLAESMSKLKRKIREEDERMQALQEQRTQLNAQIEDLRRAVSEIDRAIGEKEALLANIPLQIEDVKRRRHEELLEIDKEFRARLNKIRRERDAHQLETMRRIEGERRKLNEIVKNTSEITAQIDRLIEAKSSFILELQNSAIFLPKNLRIETPTLLQIPLYLVCYRTPIGRGYMLHSPVTVKKIVKIFRKIAIRMENFDKLIKEQIVKKMQQDASYEAEVLDLCTRVNILKDPEMPEALLRGLNQLKLRKLISTKEANRTAASIGGLFSK